MNGLITVQLLTTKLGGEAHGDTCSLRSTKVRITSPLAVRPLLGILCSANPLAVSPHPLPSPVLGALLHHSSLSVPIPQSIFHLSNHEKNLHSTSLQPALVLCSPHFPSPPLRKDMGILGLRNCSQTVGASGE